MNLTRTLLLGVALNGVAIAAMCDRVLAQAQQESPGDRSTAQDDWQQRVLKRPQQAQWHAAGQPANVPSPVIQKEHTPVQFQQVTGPRHKPYQSARRASYEQNVFDAPSAPQEPVVKGQQRAPAATNMEVIPPGQTQFEPVASEGPFAEQDGCATCGGDGCDACGPCGPPCGEVCDFGWEPFDGHCGRWLRGLSIFMGADAFKGPLDNGMNGNYGLNEGINLARPLGDPWGCGYQLGANFVQSDFSGTPFTQNSRLHGYRRQYFATAGIFRRADPCGGFQWGIGYDYLHDVYYDKANLQQIRSETGYKFDDIYEFGYYGVYGVGGDQLWNGRTIDGKLESTDMFVLYLRRNFENGGDGRIWGGATGQGDGLLGVDVWVPLGKSLALENRVNYKIPKGGHTDAQPGESWGLLIQLVWYPGQNAKCQQQNPYRPMFNVADNSLLMVDRLSH